MKILIADDDRDTRMLLKALISKRGYEVVLAGNGDETWRIMQEEGAPRLVVLDWMMPGREGPEICEKIRESTILPAPYIIMLTAKRNKEDIISGLGSGADDYITKPFDKEQLYARIDVGIRTIKLQMALEDKIKALEEAMSHIKTLQGILPICSYCHRIRDDKESWQMLEKYISEHSDVQFSHGICEECMEKHFPELTKNKEERD